MRKQRANLLLDSAIRWDLLDSKSAFIWIRNLMMLLLGLKNMRLNLLTSSFLSQSSHS